jgi:hypothetical protein
MTVSAPSEVPCPCGPTLVPDKLYQLLDKWIIRENCLLCYDFTLVQQLPDILSENFGIRTSSDVLACADLVRLFDLVDTQKYEISQLPGLIERTGIDLSRYSTIGSLKQIGNSDEQFSRLTKAVQNDGSQAIEAIRTMQMDLGQGREHGSKYEAHLLDENNLPIYLQRVSSVRPTPLQKFMNSSFWGILIEAWKYQGYLKPSMPSLSIGPRWLTEILYFRRIHGLSNHIGLDLFSDDPQMVVAGDMHAIPFPDNHFTFIFLKNVMDKSYNMRLLVKELIRVVAPGGIIVADHDCSLGFNTPLTRTDIQKSRNLLRLFSSRTELVSLIVEDTDITPNYPPDATITYRLNSRLGIRIHKGKSI